MIASVSLTGWKAFDALDLTLGTGTTVLVARNGVGKSSFVEAVTWALLGSALSHVDGALARRGDDDTSVSLTLDWDGEPLTVTRSLVQGRAKVPKEEVEFDGAVSGSTQEEWLDVLTHGWGATPALAGRLSCLPEHAVWSELSQPVSTDVDAAVRRLLRLDELEALAVTARREATKSERAVKEAASVSADQVEAARGELTVAEAAHADVEQELDRLRAAYSARAGRARCTAAIAASRDLAGSVLGSAPPPGLGHAQLVEAVERRAHELGAQLAQDRALLELNRRHQQDLRPDGECPVCVRPLDASTVAVATERHARMVGELEARISQAAGAEETARAAVRRLAELDPGAPPEEAPDDPRSDEELLAAGKAAAVRAEDVRDQLGVARATLASYEQGTEAFGRAVRASRRQALAKLVQETAVHTTAAVTSAAVTPLSALVREQWQRLPLGAFLDLTEDGRVEVLRAGRRLDYRSLSAGERAQVVLLYRVAALKALTRVPFLLLDEPLEHLDAENRLRLGHLVCTLATSGALAQTLVTTYDEEMAQRLAAEHPRVTLRLLENE